MEITSVEASVHEVPVEVPLIDEPFRRRYVFTEVETDDGTTGHGLTGFLYPLATRAMINEEVAPLIEGTNPIETERVWDRMHRELNPRDQTGPWSTAVSAVDIALWDIKGKALGEPVWRLLGGAQNPVESYVTFGLHEYSEAQLVEVARDLVDRGETRLKMVVGRPEPDIGRDASRVNRIEQYERIRREYGRVEEFKKLHRAYGKETPGAATADTTLRHYIAYTIAQKGGRITPDDVAEVLIEHLNLDRVWVNSEILVKKLSAGVNPWVAGQGTISNNKIASAITPVGIINAGDPSQAFQDGFNVGSVFQTGHDRDAAATVAAGIAEAIRPDATVESVTATMMDHAPSVVHRAIDLALGVAERSGSPEAFVEAYYENMLDWRWPAVQWDREKYYEGRVFSASTLESLPVAVAMVTLCDGDVNRSIVESAGFGRDSDAIATVAGSITGAIEGADAIRSDWIERCERANTDLFEELEDDPDADFRTMSTRLVTALENERRRAGEREQQLARLLEDAA